MNIEKADYATIIRFGTLHDLYMKLQMEGKNLIEVSNITDKEGISLLEKSLIARKFDIAKELLANNAKVNNVSNVGCNEFHYLACNSNCDGALDIARILLAKGTSLMEKEKNTVIQHFSLYVKKCLRHVPPKGWILSRNVLLRYRTTMIVTRWDTALECL